MSFINQATKDRIDQIHLDAFDTYARSTLFKFYLPVKEVVVDDPDFLYEYDTLDSTINEREVQVHEFKCCLQYLLRQEFSDFIKGTDTNVRFRAVYNRIKIQVKEEAFEVLKEAERYIFENEVYAIEQSWRRLGSFGGFIIMELILQRVV